MCMLKPFLDFFLLYILSPEFLSSLLIYMFPAIPAPDNLFCIKHSSFNKQTKMPFPLCKGFSILQILHVSACVINFLSYVSPEMQKCIMSFEGSIGSFTFGFLSKDLAFNSYLLVFFYMPWNFDPRMTKYKSLIHHFSN